MARRSKKRANKTRKKAVSSESKVRVPSEAQLENEVKNELGRLFPSLAPLQLTVQRTFAIRLGHNEAPIQGWERDILMHDLRRLALKGTNLERAQCTTIRLKLLKIGAQIHVTVRRVWIRMAAGYPYKDVFQQAFDNLQQIPLHC